MLFVLAIRKFLKAAVLGRPTKSDIFSQNCVQANVGILLGIIRIFMMRLFCSPPHALSAH